MKLEISLLGDFYTVGLLHLDRHMIKAGMQAYGTKGWARMLGQLASHEDSGDLWQEVREKTGRAVSRVYAKSGVLLGGKHFCFEVFLDGVSQEFERIEEESHKIRLSKMTERLRKKEILGVCRATGIGSVTFRWDGVDGFDQDMVLLEIHELSQVLNEPKRINLIHNITYEGRAADSQRRDSSENLAPLPHIFHMMG
ncbi:hypothetical protein [Salidesulfovibrio onnuriiensis]|uniref:hypothetical protein n=1 Tax=Salidesulfovibrio onnuriiensis TaxID=2583823 RepID=UPI0011C92ED9|nr:hypothetical protein [Salidesulfovibrio onnuriiensis]